MFPLGSVSNEVGYVEPKPGIPAPPSYVAQLIAYMRREGVRFC